MAAVAREIALTVGAVLGTICLLFLAAGALLDVKPLVVRSGSMEPTIATGALALSHTVAADELAVDDIVSVETVSGTRVTHRVVEIQREGSRAFLTLKGDANGSVDQEVYSVTSAERVVLDVPYLGYIIAWTTTSSGVFLGGLAAGGLLLLAFRSPIRGQPSNRAKDTGASPRVQALGATILVAGIGLGGHVGLETQDTWALWSDTANLSGFAASAYTLPAPVIASCANTPTGTTTARHVTLTWPGVAGPPTTYSAVTSDPSGTFSPASITVSGTSTVTADVQYDASTTANRGKTVTVTVTPRLRDTVTWMGPTDTWKFLTAGNSNQASCGEKNPPTAAFTAPDTTTRTAAAEQTYIGGSTGCNNNGKPACGTMSDASTIASVDYIFQRVQGGTTLCWSGTAYTSDCTTWRAGTIASQTTWNLTGAKTTVYATPGGSFTIDVRVTDVWGNSTTLSRSFTVTP